jgi:cytochrome bd ubiquinol oxidase subunit I
MDVATLSRLQFALTIGFHYIFPPMTIGLGLVLVGLEALYLRTRSQVYEDATRFWVRVFGLVFAIGVASGIVMEFQFGTNWATYSRFVGDVFGSALAAEGIFAFFLESGFLGILLFGWNRVGPRTHFLATCMVALGSMFSAVWIVVANSWQQTPAGYHIVGSGAAARAEITDFWLLVFNPSSVQRLSHVLSGAWQAGATLVLSVSAYYLLKGRHPEVARASIRVALVLFVFASLFQLFTGHQGAVGVSINQPAKMAAFEAHYEPSAPAPLYLFGWVDEPSQRAVGIAIPGFLSYLITGSPSAPVTGLNAFPAADRPPVQFVFQTYHLMVAIGVGLIALALLSALQEWRGRLRHSRWLLGLLVISVAGPQISNQLGWASAEVGRQPWIVYGLLRTQDAISRVVTADQVVSTTLMFGLLYLLLFAVFIYLLNDKIMHGPGADASEEGGRA